MWCMQNEFMHAGTGGTQSWYAWIYVAAYTYSIVPPYGQSNLVLFYNIFLCFYSRIKIFD